MTEPRVYRHLALPAALLALVLWSDLANAQTLADPPFARIGKGPLNQAMYSPDGALLAAPGRDGIWLYDPSNLEQIGFLGGHQGTVWSVAFSPDGRYLVSGGEDRTVRLWDMTSRREIVAWEGHQSPVFCVAFSPDGRLCASGSNNSNGNEVRLWDVENRQALGVLANYAGAWVFAVAFSPDGQHLAVATGKGSRGDVQIWEVGTWKTAKELRGYPRDITDVAFSPDGRYLALAGADRNLRLLDAATYQELRAFYDPDARALAFSPDSRYLATSPSGNIYDVEQQHQVLSLSLAALGTPKASVSFSPTGDNLALTVGGEIYSTGYTRSTWLRIWSWRPGQPAEQWPTGVQNISHLALGPDGELLALAADSTIYLWDAAQRRVHSTLKGDAGGVRSLALSADGRTLASLPNYGGIRLWNLEKGGPGVLLSEAFNAMALAPDRPWLAGAKGDATVRIWDLDQLQEIAVLRGHRNSLSSVAFSPDGRLLASAGVVDGTIRLWDMDSLAEVAVLRGHVNGVYLVAFSPDGKLLASTGGDQQVRLWDVATRRQVGTIAAEGGIQFIPGTRLLSVGGRLWEVSGEPKRWGVITLPNEWRSSLSAFTPDGRYLATWDLAGAVALWEVAQFQARERVLEGEVSPASLALSPDARLLAIGGSDGTLRLWDVARLRELATFAGPYYSFSYGIGLLAFSPDGTLLAAGGGDEIVRLWDVAQQQELPPLGRVAQVGYLEFSPNGKQLVSVGLDEVVRLWDVAGREQLSTWPGKRAAFSPDGRLLAFSTGAPLYNQIALWDLAAQQEIARLQGHQGAVIWMGFSPDSRFLASGGFSEEVWLWDTIKGESANPQPYRGEVAAFSPDGKLLAVGQHAGAVQLWDREEGRELGMLERGTTAPTWMQFSADGKLLLVHNEGAHLRLWDLESQRLVKELEGGADWAAFSADRRTLATGSRDSKVLLWGARPSPIETAVAAEALPLPLRPALLPAYPNPFNGQVVIPYQLTQEGRATLVIYNLAGQMVRKLVSEAQPPGLHQVLWDGRDEAGRELASGVYCYRLETAHWAETRKMLVLR